IVTLLTTDRGEKPKFPTAARMLWDDDAIYLAFECDDPDVHAPLTEHDAPLYNHDLVEVFLDTARSGLQYMELHVAPSGATADVIWADFDPASDWFTEPGWEHFDVGLAVKAFTLPGLEVALKINGTLNNPADIDEGYVVEWRVPFAGMRKVVPDLAKSKPHPIDMTRFELAPIDKPVVGTVWRMNFNRCDDSLKLQTTNAKGKTVNVCEYTAWSPPIRSNHMPFRFGIVRFVE
ncbi:MAG TPA: carbohydrate-binding family 9-like protein, partial [Planctomycetota bacterium]|nr:carbohydrate-binding family 9-like protein [Planctomycetota bacterium]